MAIKSEQDLRQLVFETDYGFKVSVNEIEDKFSLTIKWSESTEQLRMNLEDFLTIADRIKVLLPFPPEG